MGRRKIMDVVTVLFANVGEKTQAKQKVMTIIVAYLVRYEIIN